MPNRSKKYNPAKSLYTVLILFIAISTTMTLSAQSDEVLRVRNISYLGLTKTKASYLNNIIKTMPGDAFVISNIKNDAQNLQNLSGIGRAEFSVDTIANTVDVNYIIEEIQTLLPIVNFGGIKDNIWFELGITDNNLRGLDQQLSTFYQYNDGFHSGQLYYTAPRIANTTWGYSVSLTKWTSLEPLKFSEGTVDYIYDNNNIGLTAIKYIGTRRKIELGGTASKEDYNKNGEQTIHPVPGPDALTEHKFLSSLVYQEDFLNYHYFYVKGLHWKTTYQNVYTKEVQSLFNSIRLEGRFYLLPRPKMNFAFRLNFGLSTNNDSPFAPFVVDSHVNLRGVGNRIDRGTAQLVINAEYRQTLLHINNWGSQFVVFSDIGSWRKPGGKLSDLIDKDGIFPFVGMGFRLIYQKVYGAIIRVDYGVNIVDTKRRGFVIGLGQYF